MKLELITHPPDIETIIATSMLSTTSGALPSILYHRLKQNSEKVKETVGRVEAQHGNILEHNRLVWRLEESSENVLEIMLRSKFFNFTEIGNDTWLMSCNLRTIIEYSQGVSDEFTEALIQSIREFSPTIHEYIRRQRK